MGDRNAEPHGEPLAVETARSYAAWRGYDPDLYDHHATCTDEGWSIDFTPTEDRKADPGDFFTVIVSSEDVRIVWGK